MKVKIDPGERTQVRNPRRSRNGKTDTGTVTLKDGSLHVRRSTLVLRKREIPVRDTLSPGGRPRILWYLAEKEGTDIRKVYSKGLGSLCSES